MVEYWIEGIDDQHSLCREITCTKHNYFGFTIIIYEFILLILHFIALSLLNVLVAMHREMRFDAPQVNMHAHVNMTQFICILWENIKATSPLSATAPLASKQARSRLRLAPVRLLVRISQFNSLTVLQRELL